MKKICTIYLNHPKITNEKTNTFHIKRLKLIIKNTIIKFMHVKENFWVALKEIIFEHFVAKLNYMLS